MKKKEEFDPSKCGLVIGGRRYPMRGSGLGGIFRKFFHWIVPLVEKHSLPMIEQGVKALGDEVIKSTADVAKDIIQGEDIEEAASNRFDLAVNNLKRKAVNTLASLSKRKPNSDLVGGSIKEKKKSENYIILKKRKGVKTRTLDIFDKN